MASSRPLSHGTGRPFSPVGHLVHFLACLLAFQIIYNPSASTGHLDTSLLEECCRFFLVQGLAQSTQASYASGQRRFHDFCLQAGKLHSTSSPCPTNEWTLSLFVSFLTDSIQHTSIKVYLSAVRSLHIE